MSRGTRILCVVAFLPVILAWGCASAPSRQGLSERDQRIEAKLVEAEGLGAASCSPRELARARVALEHARHEASEPHYPVHWLAHGYAEAEDAADRLLELRRQAALLGAGSRFQCFSRRERPPESPVR